LLFLVVVLLFELYSDIVFFVFRFDFNYYKVMLY